MRNVKAKMVDVAETFSGDAPSHSKRSCYLSERWRNRGHVQPRRPERAGPRQPQGNLSGLWAILSCLSRGALPALPRTKSASNGWIFSRSEVALRNARNLEAELRFLINALGLPRFCPAPAESPSPDPSPVPPPAADPSRSSRTRHRARGSSRSIRGRRDTSTTNAALQRDRRRPPLASLGTGRFQESLG